MPGLCVDKAVLPSCSPMAVLRPRILTERKCATRVFKQRGRIGDAAVNAQEVKMFE